MDEIQRKNLYFRRNGNVINICSICGSRFTATNGREVCGECLNSFKSV